MERTDYRNVVDLNDISLVLDGKKILQNLSWLVKKKQHWALIGPNGSGKTTLLRLINGYLWPTSGTATVLGKNFGRYDLRELRKSIGFASSFLSEKMPQNMLVLDAVLSGRFASIGLHDQPSALEVRKAKSLLRQVGCLQFAAKTYHSLSHGERQRVIIARALMSSPQLLALDESCDGLDLDARESFLRVLDAVGRKTNGPTLIFATHRVEEIVPVFTHTLILKEGRVVAAGPKRAVLTGRNLSKAFMRNVTVVTRRGRYSTLVS